MKKQKGITLVALVITIIILLILAGITISQLTGSGLFENARLAEEKSTKSEMVESVTLALQELQLEKRGKATLDDVTQEWVDSKLKKYKNTVTEDAENNSKKITMEKDGITVDYVLDEKFGAAEPEDYGDAIVISSAQQLQQIATNVNQGINDYEGEEIVLKNDIDLSSICSEEKGSWVGIGYYNSEEDYKAFKGTFDGRGCTIKNLYINESTGNYKGLFSVLENGTVKNLILEEGSVTGNIFVASIVAFNKGGIVYNCHNYNSISAIDQVVGGIVGYNTGTIERCSNNGTIKLIGANSGHRGVNIGGICGWMTSDDAIVKECINRGTIDSSSITLGYSTGGILGAGNKGKIQYSYNKGSVSGAYFTGGIIGCSDGLNDISYCYNIGQVRGGSYTYPIIGQIQVATNIHDTYFSAGTGSAHFSGTTAVSADSMNNETFISQLTKSDETKVIWKLNANGDNILLNWE